MTKKQRNSAKNQTAKSRAFGSGKSKGFSKKFSAFAIVALVALLFGAASYLWGDQFRHSSAAVAQRFPGDPNPLASGKAFFGSSGEHITEHESASGKSVGLYRKFYQWNTASSAASAIKSNFAINRMMWISFKTPKWADVANGSYDSTLDSMLRTVDAAGHPVWVTFWHEPENDEGSASAGSAADYVNMQKRIRARMTAVGTKNIAFAPIYQSSQIVSMGSTHNNWYAAGIWDFIGFDIYKQNDTQTILDSKWTSTMNWVLSKGLPYAIGEWGVRTTAPSSEITNFWNWAFTNKKDMVGIAYFDSDANSVGSWVLAGANNTAFNTILKSDTRVMRVSELGSSVSSGGSTGGTGGTGGSGGGTGGGTTADTTKPSVSITSPSSGATTKGTIAISASASDAVGVVSVVLRVDDAYVATDKVSPYSFSLDTKKYSKGSHTLTVKAYDKAGNVAEDSQSVTVDNSTASQPPADEPDQPTVIDSSTPSSPSNPVKVSGTVEIQPSSSSKNVSVKVDGKAISGTTIDTKKLTNGAHTVVVNEDGKTKTVSIKVENPWHIAAVNEVKSNPVPYSAGGAAAGAGLWFSHRRLFEGIAKVVGFIGSKF